jgi:AcrR family transcriptional regulator
MAVSTRERLIDATARIIRERGLTAVTTKDVAQEAGFAEATIYRHFQDKTDLLLHVLSERIPGHYLTLIRDLPQHAGSGDVASTLTELATAAIAFFTQNAPITAALGADPALAASHYQRLRDLGSGPDVAQASIATYLAAEQHLGRVNPAIHPIPAASLLLGVCFNYAHARHVMGEHPTGLPPEQYAAAIVHTLMTGLTPRNEALADRR